jgi:tetratricopeptide (TPR) repeat protein
MFIRLNDIWKAIQVKILLPLGVFLIGCSLSLYGGAIWSGTYAVQIGFFIASLLFLIIAYLYRRWDTYAKLPRLGIEWAIAISLLVIISSWILSPLPRQGIWRMGTLIGYFALLYLLVDLFVHGFDGRLILNVFFIIVGFYMFSAMLETVLAYQGWIASIQPLKMLPPTIYRFSSLLGHSNALIAAANLLAPIGVLNFLKQKKFSGKFAYLLWFMLYALCLLFSSSRGGYLGLLVWVSILLAYVLFFSKSEFFLKNKKWIIRGLIIAGFLSLLLIVLFGGYLTTHPSHGTKLLSTREIMWLDALKIWKNSPWFGAGPGRVPFEMLNIDSMIPPRYFPNHVHSTWLQILAEFGITGFLCFLFLTLQGITSILDYWKSLSTDKKILGVSYLASFGGFFVHSILDDFTGWVFVMGIFICLLAMYFSLMPGKMAKWREINLRAIYLPLGILLLAGGFSLWSQIPFRQGVTLYEEGHYSEAALKITESIKRDPLSSYLSTQAALAWSVVWDETGEEEALVKARQYFRNSISLEDSPSFLWADLAVMDWYLGDHMIAMEHIQHAIEISDHEPSHFLIYGYFLELMNDNVEANLAYQKALDLALDSCSHPFWQQTVLRRNYACEIPQDFQTQKMGLSYLQKAAAFLRQGDIPKAQVAYQQARWMGENQLALDTFAYKLADAKNDEAAQKQAAEKLMTEDLIFDNYQNNDLYHLVFSRWLYHTKGLDFILVPGYLQVSPDYGQFGIVNQYFQKEIKTLDPEKAAEIETLLFRAIHAGALSPSLE